MKGKRMIPRTMKAMVLDGPGRGLQLRGVPVPRPGPDQVLVKVRFCGVCRTDLHIVDGELPNPRLPLIPGHEVVGTVAEIGERVNEFSPGERIGVPWLGSTCGVCPYCLRGDENLCDHPLFTGYTLDGGYAEYAVADRRYCFRLPETYADAEAAPLLCAGLIGYRTYRMAGDGVERLGIYGFGAAAHIVTQIAVHEGKRVYAFTRPGDGAGQEFARRCGAAWAGGADELPPELLDAALLFAPAGELVPAALRASAKGAVIVSGGIHMSDIPSFPYRLLWEERVVRSVANLTRRDGEELLSLAPQVPVRTQTQIFPLAEAGRALAALRSGKVEGAAVLAVSDGSPG